MTPRDRPSALANGYGGYVARRKYRDAGTDALVTFNDPALYLGGPRVTALKFAAINPPAPLVKRFHNFIGRFVTRCSENLSSNVTHNPPYSHAGEPLLPLPHAHL